MTTSSKLGIPFISSQQAQPEVTHNIALAMLQALALGATDQRNTPPASPDDFDCYLVGTVPTDDWVGYDNKVAIFFGGWIYVPGNDSDGTPLTMGAAQEGLTIYLVSEAGQVTWNGVAWEGTSLASSG